MHCGRGPRAPGRARRPRRTGDGCTDGGAAAPGGRPAGGPGPGGGGRPWSPGWCRWGAAVSAPPDPVPVGGRAGRRPAAPASFTRTGDAAPDQPLHLALGARAATRAPWQEQVLAAATPGTTTWGHHLSVGDVAAGWASPPATGEGRGSTPWAPRASPPGVDASGMYVHATPTVAQASVAVRRDVRHLRGARLHRRRHRLGGRRPSRRPPVPGSLDGLVAELTGFTLALPYTTFPWEAATPRARSLPPGAHQHGDPLGVPGGGVQRRLHPGPAGHRLRDRRPWPHPTVGGGGGRPRGGAHRRRRSARRPGRGLPVLLRHGGARADGAPRAARRTRPSSRPRPSCTATSRPSSAWRPTSSASTSTRASAG